MIQLPFPTMGSAQRRSGGSAGDVMPGRLTLADLGTSLLILIL